MKIEHRLGYSPSGQGLYEDRDFDTHEYIPKHTFICQGWCFTACAIMFLFMALYTISYEVNV